MSETSIPTVKLPNLPLPDKAPDITMDYIYGQGEQREESWPAGTEEEMWAKYKLEKQNADIGFGNVSQVQLRGSGGRYSVIKRFGRTGGGIFVGLPGDISTVEELIAFDVMKDIRTAPYFSNPIEDNEVAAWGDRDAKGLPLVNDEVAFVTLCVEQNWTESKITAFAISAEGAAFGVPAYQASWKYEDWQDGLKELRWQMLHGTDTYYETAFELRRTKYGIKQSAIKVDYATINHVVPTPKFLSGMDQLVKKLPAGEWLYKTPTVENLGHGKWRVSEIWQWAEKWSIVYGGSWKMST